MGLCSGEEEDCPVLESTERVKTGRAKKYTSESKISPFTHISHLISHLHVFTEKWYGKVWKDVELVLYSDSVLAWYDEVCPISLF